MNEAFRLQFQDTEDVQDSFIIASKLQRKNVPLDHFPEQQDDCSVAGAGENCATGKADVI